MRNLTRSRSSSSLPPASDTPRQGIATRGVRLDFTSPVGQPRGNSTGRPTGPGSTKRVIAARTTSLHEPSTVQKRARSYSDNTALAARYERARAYKEDKDLGRRTAVHVVEKVVYLKAKRKLLARGNESLDVDHLLPFHEQLWLHRYIKDSANTKNSTLFINDFVKALKNEWNRTLTEREMTKVVHALGFGYCKLLPGYYDAAWNDFWNQERRRHVVPLLWYCFNHPKIVVWNFDESALYIYHHHGSGWVDLSESNSCRVPYIKNGAKGPRYNIAAFISERFGALVDPDTGRFVGELNLGGTNTTESVAAVFDRFGAVVSKKYPGYLHVVQTDGPKIHCALVADACNPNKVNLSDGGKNRGNDQYFGDLGLYRIYSEHYDEEHPNWKLADFRADLWDKPEIRSQPLLLEAVLARYGCLLILNPIAHPVLAAIELLWRDIKFDYATNWQHTGRELEECVHRWLCDPEDPLGADYVAGYFRTVRAYLQYFLHGGSARVSEYAVKRMHESGFEELEQGATKKEAAMQALYSSLPGLPRTPNQKKQMSTDELRKELEDHCHELNWMRLRRGIEKEGKDVEDDEEDGE